MTDWFKARLGRMRVSTVVLLAVFIALFWVHQTFEPEPPRPQAPAVVPPGFVPDPNYTWVPRTQVRRPKEPVYTTTTTTTTAPTTTTSPTETSPTETPTTTSPTPTTTLVDPDGSGPLPPTTQTLAPETTTPALPTPTTAVTPPS